MVAIMQALATPCSAASKDASALDASISACRSSISALESSLKKTEGSSGGWETFAWVCSVAVAIGVAAEIVGIVWEYRDDLTAWRRGIVRSPDRPSFVKFFWFEVVATIVVVAGIFGEAWASKELSNINSQLRSKTSELRADSDQLLAWVMQEEGELRRQTEGERTARVEAEESVAWRSLNTREEAELRNRLSGFSIHRTWFIYDLTDIEAFTFGHDLADSLPKSWNATEPMPMIRAREGPVPLGKAPAPDRGVIVSAIGDQTYADAANNLVSLISSLGFDCARSPSAPINDPQYNPAVFVFIEPRPQGLQGQFKLRAEQGEKAKSNPTAKQ